MTRANRSRLAAIVLPAFLMTATAWSAPDVEEAPWTEVETRGIELLRGLRDPEAPPPEASGKLLAELGTGTVDLLLTVLEERRVPGLELPAEDAQILSRPQRETILTALGRLESGAVTVRLQARYETLEDLAQRRAYVEAFGAVAGSGDLNHLIEVVREEEAELHPRLTEPLEQAVQSVLSRDPYGFQVLQREWGNFTTPELQVVIRAVGSTRDSQGLAFLADLHDWAPEQGNLIAAQIPLVAPSDEVRLNARMAAALLAQLDSEDQNLVNATIHGLGSLEEFHCVPRLIDMLGSELPAQRANAHHALTQLLNMSTRPSHKLWQTWYREEERWARKRSASVLASLNSPRQRDVLSALKEIGLHRLDRHRLALAVSVVLRNPTESIRKTACDALAGLGSRWAIEPLREALADDAESVRNAAAMALRSITGEDHPAEPLAWNGVQGPQLSRF